MRNLCRIVLIWNFCAKLNYNQLRFTGTCLAIVTAAVTVVAFSIGILIGWLSTGQDAPDYYGEYSLASKPLDMYSEALFDIGDAAGDVDRREREWNKRESERDLSDERIVYNYVRRRLDANQLRAQIGMIAERPRMAGSEPDTRVARMIEKKFLEYGLDSVRMLPYRLLLSRPSVEIPNRVYLLDAQDGDRILLESSHRETAPELDPEHNVSPAFSAYSPAGDVTAVYVYANYGRLSDFDVVSAAGVDVAGKIVVMRYGKIFAGEKVKLAQNRGALGVVLYADPAEVAYFGTLPGYVYPNSAWLPADGIRRERVNTGMGDPATPTWPSTEYAYHQWANQSVPVTIPVQPIKYSDAVQLLTVLEGPEAPSNASWTGRLPGVPKYRIGPNDRYRIRILSSNQLVEATCFNVIGYMYGQYESQRYVMLGSHRDSFTRGVTDSASGTAVMLELARVLSGARRERNWQPRRTVMFASWAAHDYGSIGAFEYAQQFTAELRARSVAYINSDMCAAGCRPQLRASPLLASLIRSVLHRVDDPSSPRQSLFERMLYPNEQQSLGGGGGFYARGSVAATGGGIDGFAGGRRVGIYDYGGPDRRDEGGNYDRNDFYNNTPAGRRDYGYGGGGGQQRDFDIIDGGRPRVVSPADEFGVYDGPYNTNNPRQDYRPTPPSFTRTTGSSDRDYFSNRRGGAGGGGRGGDVSVYSRLPFSANTRLEIKYPNGGGDYAPFLYYLGVPVVDVQFRYEPDLSRMPRPLPPPPQPVGVAAATGGVLPGVNIDIQRPTPFSFDDPVDRSNPFPAHNTAYQTGRMLEQLDPGLHCHIACAKVSADLVVALVDSMVLPFNVSEFALALRRMWDDFSTNRQVELLEFGGAAYTPRFRAKIDEFIHAAGEFQNSIIRLYSERRSSTLNPFTVRRMNDQMMLIERIFTSDRSAVPGPYPQYRHMLASPSTIDNSRGVGFPGIHDRLTVLRNPTLTDEGRLDARRGLEIEFTHLIAAVDAAIEILQPHMTKEENQNVERF